MFLSYWFWGNRFLGHFADVLRVEQMLDLKENIENEIHAAYDEYLKLESHVKLYITEMEQAI